jgi:hypothetical protein
MARGSSEITETFEIRAMLMRRGFGSSDPATGTSSNEDAVTDFTGGILTDLSPSSDNP